MEEYKLLDFKTDEYSGVVLD